MARAIETLSGERRRLVGAPEPLTAFCRRNAKSRLAARGSVGSAAASAPVGPVDRLLVKGWMASAAPANRPERSTARRLCKGLIVCIADTPSRLSALLGYGKGDFRPVSYTHLRA